MVNGRFGAPPSLVDLTAIAEQVLANLPSWLAPHLGNILVRVDEFPDEETEDEMDLETPFDILGLYRGVALTHKSVTDPQGQADVVFLYRRPILDYWCESGDDLSDIVRNVLIHEIGHHLGFDDDEMERLEADED